MLQSTVHFTGPGPLRVAQAVLNSIYAVYVYLAENNQDAYPILDVVVAGNPARAAWSAPRGAWGRLGPYIVTVSDGTLHVDIIATTGDPSSRG